MGEKPKNEWNEWMKYTQNVLSTMHTKKTSGINVAGNANSGKKYLARNVATIIVPYKS